MIGDWLTDLLELIRGLLLTLAIISSIFLFSFVIPDCFLVSVKPVIPDERFIGIEYMKTDPVKKFYGI